MVSLYRYLDPEFCRRPHTPIRPQDELLRFAATFVIQRCRFERQCLKMHVDK